MRKIVIGVAGALLATTFPAAMLAGNELQVQEKNGISYVSGGVGDEEQTQLDTMSNRFNLKVTLATSSGKYMGATPVHIENAKSGNVLELDTTGPILLVDLEPGTYQVRVSEAGKDATKNVSIEGEGQKQLVFSWEDNSPEPAGDAPVPADPRSMGEVEE